MKIRKIVVSISILLITAVGIIIAERIADAKSAITYQIQAQPAADFVDMGINAKFGYCPGLLCDNYLEVKELLAKLGIRYIQDIPYPEFWRIRKHLYRDLGIRMAVDIIRTWGQPLEKENIASQLIAIKKWGKMIIGIVGINEYDNPVIQSCEQTKGCDPDWSEKYTRFQKKVFQAVKSDRNLDIPVVLGSMIHLINDAIIKSAKTYRLYNATEPSAKLSPIKSWTNVSKLSLAVPDDILVVEFRTSTAEP